MAKGKTLEERWLNWKWQRKEDIRCAAQWVSDNKEVVMVAVPIIVGATGAVIKFARKEHQLNQERNLKELYCYNRSNGHYYRLNRKLSSSEWMTIDRRKANGELLGDILNDMGVLK